MNDVTDIGERRDRHRRWLGLEADRLRRLQRLRVLDGVDVDLRIAAIEAKIAEMDSERLTTGEHRR